MPNYDYGCTHCGAAWVEFRLIDDRLTPETLPCPTCGNVGSVGKNVNAGGIVSGVNMRSKMPSGFKDVISKIKKAHPTHKLDGELTP